MLRHLKISHHQHTGQLRPHEHTSYLPLAFLVFLVGMALAVFTVSAMAATPYTGPEAGSIGLTGSVPADPPTTPAVITSPSNNQRFNKTPITVSGSCPSNTVVEIYKNNIFAGATTCNSGKFSVEIDLLFGKNILKAQIYDALNQAGPESDKVTVFYDTNLPLPDPASFADFSGLQLLLNTDGVFRGTFPNQQLNVPITVIGGTPPFAINVEWGDNDNQIISRSDNSTFNAAHKYTKAGTYKITLQGSDKKQLVAFLTVAAIVNGKPEALATSAVSKIPVNKLLVLWPVYAVAATALLSFWFGERREKKILGSGRPQTPSFGGAPQPPAQNNQKPS